MSSAAGYANSLSACANKGELNLASEPEASTATLAKSCILARRIRKAKHVVLHTGAGLSTAAGIRDFRGPCGVWTTEQRRKRRRVDEGHERNNNDVSFERAVPTLAHMGIVALMRAGNVAYVISQNVDGLHGRSGVSRTRLSELHGNLFVEWCDVCGDERVREREVGSVGYQRTGTRCRISGCDGWMTDKALDWDDALPEPDFSRAEMECERADFQVVMGSSCQMEPARGLPFRGGSGRGVVICNLSRTGFDDRVAFCVREKVDVVMAVVLRELGVRVPIYRRVVEVGVRVVREGTMLKCVVCGLEGDGSAWVKCVRYRGLYGVEGCEGDVKVEGVKQEDEPTDAKSVESNKHGPWHKGNASQHHQSSIPSTRNNQFLQKIQADITLHTEGTPCQKRLHILPDNTTLAKMAVSQVDYNVRAERLVCELEEAARREREKGRMGLERDGEWEWRTWFVRGGRRGWFECVVCGVEVWCGQRGREKHFDCCVVREGVRVEGV